MVWAGQVLINADAPYLEGTVAARRGTIEDYYAAHIWNDTVVLSVGYSFEAAIYPVLIPENGGFWEAVMATDTLHVRGGFRANPNLYYTGGPSCCYGHSTLGNPDTVWDEATAFPDSLAPLDSIDQTGYWRPTSGKWYSVCFSPICGYVSDWNAIFYIECPGPRHLKLQVAGRSSDTVFVRWAVDSAGNGLFRTAPVAVKQPSVRTVQAAGSPANQQVFDLRGGLLTSRHRSGVAVRRNGSSGRAAVEVLAGEDRVR